MQEALDGKEKEEKFRTGCIEGDEGKKHVVPSGMAEGPAAGWQTFCAWKFARRGAYAWVEFAMEGNWCKTCLKAVAG